MTTEQYAASLRLIPIFAGILLHPDASKVYRNSNTTEKLTDLLSNLFLKCEISKKDFVAYGLRGIKDTSIIFNKKKKIYVFSYSGLI